MLRHYRGNWGKRKHYNLVTVPVAVSSSPTQSTPSKEAFLAAQIAPMIAFWSPVCSVTKSGYLLLPQPLTYVEPT